MTIIYEMKWCVVFFLLPTTFSIFDMFQNWRNWFHCQNGQINCTPYYILCRIIHNHLGVPKKLTERRILQSESFYTFRHVWMTMILVLFALVVLFWIRYCMQRCAPLIISIWALQSERCREWSYPFYVTKCWLEIFWMRFITDRNATQRSVQHETLTLTLYARMSARSGPKLLLLYCWWIEGNFVLRFKFKRSEGTIHLLYWSSILFCFFRKTCF